MALSQGRVTANTPVLAAELNQLIDLLEGAASETLAFLLKVATSENFIIRLSDAGGVQKFVIQDSAGVEVASINSDGDLTISGAFDLSAGSFVLPQGAAPSQTAEGSVSWDTDDDVLTVGNGAATKRVSLVVGAGAAAAVKGEMVYDTTLNELSLHDGSSEVTLPLDFPTLLKTLVENGVYKNVAYLGAAPINSGASLTNGEQVGVGFEALVGTGGSMSGASTSGDWSFVTGATANQATAVHGPNITYNVGNWTVGGRFIFATPAAGIQAQGMFAVTQSTSIADVNDIIGWRSITTGAVFGVCDSGGSETTRDPSFTGDGSTDATWRIEIASTGTIVRFYKDNAQVGTNVTSNIPTSTGRGAAMGIRNNTTTSYTATGADMYCYREA